MSSAAIILAAGEGKRMKSDLPKVAHAVLGRPLVGWVVAAARSAGVDDVVVVTGHGAEQVESLVPDVRFARQDEQLGTGHAVACAEAALEGLDGPVVVLAGDVPLIRPGTVGRLIEERERTGAACVLLSVEFSDPTGYGRVVRDGDGAVEAVVEQRDLTQDLLGVRECNVGVYCFDARSLFSALREVEPHNAQGEYYLTDVVGIMRSAGLAVAAVASDDEEESHGINDRVQLARVAGLLRRRVNAAHMLAGVTMTDPDLVWVGPDVTIGRDTVIEPMTFLLGSTTVGERCVIGPDSRLTDSAVADDALVDSSVVVGSRIGTGASVGPRAYLRAGTVLCAGARVGTSVEIKKSTIGAGSKVPHLSYIGDAEIGEGVNVGAGTITCNYDGWEKHTTRIGDGAFIGSDTMLVAPVEIGAGSATGAGSTISKDVPPGSLALERTDMRIVEGWAEKRRLERERTKDED